MNGGLLSLAQAREIVVATAGPPLEDEAVAVEDALGRVLAEAVAAQADVAPFANSAMDGWAVRAGPAARELRVVDESRAGRPATRAVGEGEAIRISTGAPVPEGAESVVPVEHARETDGAVVLEREATPGANIRQAGEDLRAGTEVLARGTVLRAGELGAAVAAGRAAMRCTRRPRVAVVVTGDELVAPGATLGPGQIHNSNATMLAALAAAAGAEVVASPGNAVGDDRAETEAALAAALEVADVVLVSGGVSVGPHDHVKPALQALGVQERFWRVALKPGKPVWFGARGRTLVFGLPGNPVSAAACFVLFARPALRALQGADPLPPPLSARLAQDVKRSPDREQAVRVRLASGPDGALEARPTGPQGSHMLSSLVGADGLALIPPGTSPLPAGELVAVEPM
ncbi:MAG: molybdopterin molybdotransferase [Solirubrobacteraceae bacterium]|jgi:molybdopterin molybdotransferase|nr:molybdopterin molybdotransferase [Solirubrobacteraceae bacterium]